MASRRGVTPLALRASADRLDPDAEQSKIALYLQDPNQLMAEWFREHQQDLTRSAAALRAQAALIDYIEPRLTSTPAGSLKLYALGMNDALKDVLRIVRSELVNTAPEGEG